MSLILWHYNRIPICLPGYSLQYLLGFYLGIYTQLTKRCFCGDVEKVGTTTQSTYLT